MHETRIEVNGEELLLEAAGALWWPGEATLVFADLHFEKGSFYARGGQMLPPYDTRATIGRIESVVVRRNPSRVIALGDSFHDPYAADRLDEEERERLAKLRQGVEWIWIAGNHDPMPPHWLGGRVAEEIAIGGLLFRHEPHEMNGRGEIAGHLHPCATVTRRGRSLRRRCFVSDGKRLLMPAFGAYAGGLDVYDRAIRGLFGDKFLTYLLGAARVYAVAG
ncbi:MAG TPA: ligase-associated DNA damage response endonuclease PdeM [Rhizomicrobium sp.]|nr:ligase-associated DNA damage response endonuclease PdeM [Rhizomicrobium sp.]